MQVRKTPLELVYLTFEYITNIKKQTTKTTTTKNPLSDQARLQRVENFIVDGEKESAIIDYILEKSIAQMKGERAKIA